MTKYREILRLSGLGLSQQQLRNIYFIEENRSDRTKSRNCDVSCSR